jgi:hypothetical protein
MMNLLAKIGRAIDAAAPQRFRRLWCSHPNMVVPLVPLMGPAPWKECRHCGERHALTSADQDLPLEPVSATVIDMTGNLGR